MQGVAACARTGPVETQVFCVRARGSRPSAPPVATFSPVIRPTPRLDTGLACIHPGKDVQRLTRLRVPASALNHTHVPNAPVWGVQVVRDGRISDDFCGTILSGLSMFIGNPFRIREFKLLIRDAACFSPRCNRQPFLTA